MVERWLTFARRRQDLFGCIDIVAIKAGKVLGVQATSGQCVPDHLRKMLAEPLARAWLEAGAELELWGWRRLKKSRKFEVRVIQFSRGEAGELVWKELKDLKDLKDDLKQETKKE